MTMHRRLAACLACLIARSAMASSMEKYDLFTSRFQIVSPEHLKMDLDHRDALFGKSPFGLTVEKDFFYTTRSLCDDDPSPGTPEEIAKEGYILMVDRGGCSFVTKVRNAQLANATAVIIADNMCLCDAGPTCQSDLPCEKYEPVMDDDDTGGDINVPSMLLAKQDADMLEQEMMKGTLMHLKLSWPIPKSLDGVAHYKFWTTPDDNLSQSFLETFKEAAVDLKQKAHFTPKMFLLDGTAMGCRAEGACEGKCTNGGRYCAPSDDIEYPKGENVGTKKVLESLRRACIWQIYGNSNGIGSNWWDYVSQWISTCRGSRYSTTCAESLYADASIAKNLVDTCIDSTGGFQDDVENLLLQKMLNSASEEKVIFPPTLFVNGADLRGELSFGSVLGAICLTFEEADQPGICGLWNQCENACPAGRACILKDDECMEYEPTDITSGMDYDDDILTAVEATPEPTASPVEVVDTNDSGNGSTVATAGPTVAPTMAAIDPSPTASPTGSPTGSPTARPTTKSPTHSPSTSPVEPPTMTPEKKEHGGERESSNGSHNGESSVSETIQIYEGSGGGSGMEAAAFIIGISAGVGCICVFGLGFLIALRIQRRRRRLPRRGDRKALVDPVAEMLDGDEYEYADDDYSDE